MRVGRNIGALAALAAALSATTVASATDIPAPFGDRSREPRRRNSKRKSARAHDTIREQRAAEKRARKAAKRLRDTGRGEL
jgi:hypothetical protein